MSAPTVIVFGPQGSGTTLHSNSLRRHYGCKRVLDDWSGHLHERIEPGDLVTTHLTVAELEALSNSGAFPPDTCLVDINTARRSLTLDMRHQQSQVQS